MDPQQPSPQPYIPASSSPISSGSGPSTPQLSPYIPPANDMSSSNAGFSQQQYPSPPATSSSLAPLPLTPPAPTDFNTMPPITPASPALASSPTGQPVSAGPRSDIIARLKTANNVLVTVANNPSVDQFAAAIGITLILNKLDKHATAVFSGAVPSTIEFLQPEKTIEKNTDSLRDFIIALDKAKADKLRYKVEDKFVKIFITPYHTSLSEKDLEFSQGDFNVDAVLALGVHKREDLDQAITANGRILHDATVISVTNDKPADIGAINWCDANASSLSEMLVGLIEPLQGQKALLDNQVATAFLTGVVAETERFSNTKTTPHTMSTSAILMKAGANQQLVATKLEEPQPVPQEPSVDPAKLDELAKEKAADGALQVAHKPAPAEPEPASKSLSDIEQEVAKTNNTIELEDDLNGIHIDEDGKLQQLAELKAKAEAEKVAKAPESVQKAPDGSNEMIMQPPSTGGALTANTTPDVGTGSVNPLVIPTSSQVPDYREVQHGKAIQPINTNLSTALKITADPNQSLSDIEKSVDSPHLDPANKADSTPAVQPPKIEPAGVLGSQLAPSPLSSSPPSLPPIPPAPSPDDNTVESVFPPQLIKPDVGLAPEPTAGSANPSAPPPVPPPLMPPN